MKSKFFIFTLLLALIVSSSVSLSASTSINIGDPSSIYFHDTAPFNYNWWCSIAQTIYHEAEIGHIGIITDLVYRFDGGSSVNVDPTIDHVIWLGITNSNSFTSATGWLPSTIFTKVFEGKIGTNVSGLHDIEIKLDTPFPYNSGNLVIMTQRKSIGVWVSDNYWQHTQTPGVNRTIRDQRDGPDYNADNLTIVGNLDPYYPNITLKFEDIDFGEINGVVSSSGTGLPNVTVFLEGTNRTTTTNSLGEYEFLYVVPDNYFLTYTGIGFYDGVSPSFTLNANQTHTENIDLLELPRVSVSGVVIATDTEQPFSGVSAALTGYTTIPAVYTNESGVFTIDNVYGDRTYTLTLSRAAYETVSYEIELELEDYYMGFLYLNEIPYPVVNVFAEELSGSEILVTWEAPQIPGGPNSRIFLGYNIYRSTSDNLSNPELWTVLSTNYQSTSYQDLSWGDVPINNAYRWIVTSLYSNEVESVWTFSNQLIKFVENTVYIGNVNSTYRLQDVPIPCAWENGVTQSIYLAEEIQIAGTINSIMLNYTGGASATSPDIIYTLWMANSNKERFISSNDWVPYDDFQLVYQGTIPELADQGTFDIFLNLQETFDYSGESLVIMAHKEHFGQWLYGNNFHNTQTPGIFRAMHALSENNEINPPFNTFPVGTLVQSFANIAISFDVKGMGHLEGIVLDEITEEPLENVEIIITGTNRSVFTDSEGFYSFTYIQEGLVEFSTIKHGYFNHSFSFYVLEEITSEYNFNLLALPTVSVSGIAIASDTGSGLSEATVILSGYERYETVTGSNGEFFIPNVYCYFDYNLLIHKLGYITYIDETVAVLNDDLNLGTIIVMESANPAKHVQANVIGDDVLITWRSPTLGDDVWITQGTDTDIEGALGSNEGEQVTYTAVHRFNEEHIKSLGAEGALLTKIAFFPNNAPETIGVGYGNFTLKVFVGGSAGPYNPGTEVLSQVIPQNLIVYNQWNEFYLSEPVVIPTTGELWFGYFVDQTGNVAGLDGGPSNNGYGNLLDWGGAYPGWQTLPSYFNNFMIRGYAEGVNSPILLSQNNDYVDYSGTTLRSENIVGDGNKFSRGNNFEKERINAFPTERLNEFRTRTFESYIIYRSLLNESNELMPPNEWVEIGNDIIDLQIKDTDWSTLPFGAYKYGVIAVYTGGNESEIAWSNMVERGMTSDVTITVYNMDEFSVAGSLVKLVNTSHSIEYIYTDVIPSGTNYINFPYVWKGIYNLEIIHDDFMTYNEYDISIQSDIINHEVTLITAIKVLDEGFEFEWPPLDWSHIDADEDGNSWMRVFPPGHTVNSGGYAIMSESFNWSGALTPDNWLITPQLRLSSGASTLIWYVASQDSHPLYVSEHYSVLVSRHLNEIEYFTPVYEETLTTNSWSRREISLDEFVDEEIYIAFRHHDSYDKFQMKLDDIVVKTSDLFVPQTSNVTIIIEHDENIHEAMLAHLIQGYVTYEAVAIDDIASFIDIPQGVYDLIISIDNAERYFKANLDINTPDFTYTAYIIPGNESGDVQPPTITELRANYPNPFNPVTNINFDIAKSGKVTIDIYNIRGQKVRSLIDDTYEVGRYNVQWNGTDDTGRDVSSGVYFYMMKAEDYNQIRRMLLMK